MYLNILYRFKRNCTIERNFSEEFTEESFIKAFGYVFTGYMISFGLYLAVFMHQVNKYVKFEREFTIDKIVMREDLLINVIPFDTLSDPAEILFILINRFQVGVIVLLLLSLVAWMITLFIRSRLYSNMTVGMCYTIGVYSFTVPNILLVFLYVTNNLFPAFILIYLLITAIFAYKFIDIE